MRFHLIDYSFPRNENRASEPAPARRSGKFVQMRKGDSEYLLLSPAENSAYHANIIERFCSEMGLQGRYNGKRDFFDVREPEWEVVGGGLWTMDEDAKSLSFSGASQGYGQYDRRGLREKIFSVTGMSEYDIAVD